MLLLFGGSYSFYDCLKWPTIQSRLTSQTACKAIYLDDFVSLNFMRGNVWFNWNNVGCECRHSVLKGCCFVFKAKHFRHLLRVQYYLPLEEVLHLTPFLANEFFEWPYRILPKKDLKIKINSYRVKMIKINQSKSNQPTYIQYDLPVCCHCNMK